MYFRTISLALRKFESKAKSKTPYFASVANASKHTQRLRYQTIMKHAHQSLNRQEQSLRITSRKFA